MPKQTSVGAEGGESQGHGRGVVTLCFLFQGATEDPQTALALNLDPALMKKSDPRDPTSLLFPESELSIRIGSTGLLSGKLAAAAAAGPEGQARGWW